MQASSPARFVRTERIMPMHPLSAVGLCRSLLAALCASAPLTAGAVTATPFQVSATIANGCSVDGFGTSGDVGAISTLDFGQDTVLSTAVRTADAGAAQTIVLRCTAGSALVMQIDGGQHLNGSSRNLQLGVAAANRLVYQLYRDAAFTQPIGINQNQSIVVSNTNNIRLPIYGRLALPGNRPVGTYTDTLLITLSW
ncbi:MAG: Csu type fimbrial protein [Lysobacter sp.]